ncbi:MAG: hypothetical protein JWM59_3550 [Verrucomicrobiales bacterium]|nr:hypothetical protein [Verrucomicrobiales bacterium]
MAARPRWPQRHLFPPLSLHQRVSDFSINQKLLVDPLSGLLEALLVFVPGGVEQLPMMRS